jgi:hypothetical protein
MALHYVNAKAVGALTALVALLLMVPTVSILHCGRNLHEDMTVRAACCIEGIMTVLHNLDFWWCATLCIPGRARIAAGARWCCV